MQRVLNKRNANPAAIHRRLRQAYEEQATRDATTRRVGNFSDDRENVHDRPSIDDDLVRTVREQVRGNRRVAAVLFLRPGFQDTN